MRTDARTRNHAIPRRNYDEDPASGSSDAGDATATDYELRIRVSDDYTDLYDVIPFQFSIKTSDDTNYTQKFYTNHEVLEMASPESPTLPYVYDTFEWNHCKDAGYDFDDLINTHVVVRSSDA